jgi:hypothetical protein
MTGALKSRNEFSALFAEPIAQQLASGKRNLAQWADELEKTTPQTPKELWTKYEVCVRAGRHEAAIKLLPVLRDLIESIPTQNDYGYNSTYVFHSLPYGTVYDVIRKPNDVQQKRLDLHIAFYDVFAPVYCHDLPTWTFKEAGWSNEKIADWLRKRRDAAVAYKPVQSRWSWAGLGHENSPGSPFLSDAAEVWQENYMRHLYEWRLHEPRVVPVDYNALAAKVRIEEWNRLAADAEKNPDDMSKLSLLFTSLGGYENWERDCPKLDYLAKTLEKRNGFEAWYIAHNLVRLTRNAQGKFRNDNLELALLFYQQALKLSLTDEQCKQIHEERARWLANPVPRDDEKTRAIFRAKIYDSLNKTLQMLNRADEAQAVTN